VLTQRVVFGTSGPRGCSLDSSFNEARILATTQAIGPYRKTHLAECRRHQPISSSRNRRAYVFSQKGQCPFKVMR